MHVEVIFMDDRIYNVTIPDEDLEGFLRCISHNSVFWSSKISSGIWTDMDKIRMFKFTKEEEEEEDELQEERCRCYEENDSS